MYGAILGDIIGSPYEFDMGEKTKEFPLFSPQSQFTDDSVMTLAVADALMDSTPEDENQIICERLVKSMQCFGRRYPDAGYGGMFQRWLWETAASATARPCVHLRQGGCTMIWKLPAGWQD